MRSIPIDVIRAFVAVVEARGFTRAAEALGRTQPTISLQVKRLEELVETPLFERAARFELTPVGAACFDYGRRLLRLHDEMLSETDRLKTPDARLRIGMSGEVAALLGPRLDRFRPPGAAMGCDVVSGASATMALAVDQNELDLAFVVAARAHEGAAAQWPAPLAWFVRAERAAARSDPLQVLLPASGSAVHEAAMSALRSAGRPFEIVCASADFAFRAAAAAAGLGAAPMVAGAAPEGLAPSSDPGLPALPSLVVSLLAQSEPLASAARRWAQAALAARPAA
jgi:DNA-binding transcriptional LysR family regulator